MKRRALPLTPALAIAAIVCTIVVSCISNQSAQAGIKIRTSQKSTRVVWAYYQIEGQSAKEILDKSNELGREGWELVSVLTVEKAPVSKGDVRTQDHGATYVAYFKMSVTMPVSKKPAQ